MKRKRRNVSLKTRRDTSPQGCVPLCGDNRGSEIIPDAYREAVVADFGAFGPERVVEEFPAPELIPAANVIIYAQIDAPHDESDAGTYAEVHPGENSPVAEQVLASVLGLHRTPDADAAIDACKGLDCDEVRDEEMVVDEQRHLQVERSHGHGLDLVVYRGCGPAPEARKADTCFDVERQAAVEQDLVRHGEVESRARTRFYLHVFGRDVVLRHVDAGADTQDVFLVSLCPDGTRQQDGNQNQEVFFHGSKGYSSGV